jgi:CBS domain-containing protein
MSFAEIIDGSAQAASLVRAITAADSVAAVCHQASQVNGFAHDLIDAGSGTVSVTRAISRLNDCITVRLLELIAPRFRLPPTDWCWLCFGSQGRSEQTLVTDQDNGLLFRSGNGAESEQMRAYFLPFAAAINQALAACGIPLCAGDVMASNPQWCLSLDEWSTRFTHWVRTPEPEALLNASIFFDFRALQPDAAMLDLLRQHLSQLTLSNDVFGRMMTENALSAGVPLGRINTFVTDDQNSIDLKRNGSRLIVDGVRVLALAGGIAEAGTVQRLQLLSESGRLDKDSAQALLHAFISLQTFRLQAQRQGTQMPNNLALDCVNAFDRCVLREAFRQARGLQLVLRRRFHIIG